MATISKSVPEGRWLSKQTFQNAYPYNVLTTNNTIDKSANNTSDTFDGYTFKTDWNGSSNPMRVTKGDISSTTKSGGLRFYTDGKIGKDRYLYYQYWDMNKGPWHPRVVGYTGLWEITHRQYHPRLDMVVFHYMDKNKRRVADYKVNVNLHGGYNGNSGVNYWEYQNTGQHNRLEEWHIAYALTESRIKEVINNKWLMFGMSMHIKFRTAASTDYADGTFWSFKPIIGKSNGTLTSINAVNAKAETGQLLYTRQNTGTNHPSDKFHIA